MESQERSKRSDAHPGAPGVGDRASSQRWGSRRASGGVVPPGLGFRSRAFPGLTPWATLCRPFGAGAESRWKTALNTSPNVCRTTSNIHARRPHPTTTPDNHTRRPHQMYSPWGDYTGAAFRYSLGKSHDPVHEERGQVNQHAEEYKTNDFATGKGRRSQHPPHTMLAPR